VIRIIEKVHNNCIFGVKVDVEAHGFALLVTEAGLRMHILIKKEE